MRTLSHLVLVLTLAVSQALLAAPTWVPDRGIGEGLANKVVQDGSRICAATSIGVYCRERNQEAWSLAFLEGKYVEDLVRTRSGWIAFISEAASTPPYDYEIHSYISRDGGDQWKQVQFPLERGRFGQQGLGDSLVRNDARTAMLSKDGGETWDTLPKPLESTVACTLSPGAVLCASKSTIFSHTGIEGWTIWGARNEFDHLDVFSGRIYAWNSQGILSEYSATGLVRKLSPLPGFSLFFASDSLLIASSDKAYAFAKRGETAWTLSTAPFALTGHHPPGGLWQDNAAIVHNFSSLSKARIEGGKIIFESFGQGIPSRGIRRLYSSGNSLFAVTDNAIWRSDATGQWKSIFKRDSWISPFFFVDGKAMVGSYHVDTSIVFAAPSRFSDDTGKTWQDQPASLPGFLYGMTRVGDTYLALTGRFTSSHPDSSGSLRFSVFESDAWMGTWKFRAEYNLVFPYGLIACGPRLFANTNTNAWTSLDTGKTWDPTEYRNVFEAGGDRVYAIDSGSGLWEMKNGVEPWTQVPGFVVSGEWPVFNRTPGEPLVAVYHADSVYTRIHPLPGASPIWAGIDAFPLPGTVESLASRGGVVYAVVRYLGLYVLDMQTNRVRPRPTKGRGSAGNPGPLSGWRRVDGRMIQPGESTRIPLFRPTIRR